MRGEDVLRLLEEQRRFWVDIGDGAAIQMRRPTTLELARLRGEMTTDHVLEYVVGWRGVVSSRILGAAGDGESVEFNSQLAFAWLRDEPAVVTKLAEAFVSEIDRYFKSRHSQGNASPPR